MSYTIRNNQGQTVTVIPDRHVDTTATPLALIGFDVTNYGLDHNENFISLLENFANSAPPLNPMEGQLWFNTQTDAMMLYSLGTWNPLGNSIPSITGDSTQNGLGGIYHFAISSPATSILMFFAGGELIMIMSPINLPVGSLPTSVVVESLTYPVASRFPNGVVAGTTLATDSANFQYLGDVPLADQTLFAGGGSSTNLPAGWTYASIGANTVALMVSNGEIICAVSQAAIAQSALPATVPITVLLSDHTTQTTDMVCAASFSGGLSAGMTFSSTFTVGGFVTLSLLAQNSNLQYALITQQYQAYVDANGSTAESLQTLEAAFTSAAGTSSFASAINYVLSQATDSSALTTAVTELHSDVSTALGVSDWSDALTKLTTLSTATNTSSDLLQQLQSSFQTTLGSSNIATAISHLWSQATSGSAVAGWSLSLDSNGYAVGIEALNGGATDNYIKFTTDNFLIVSPGTPAIVPFQVVNGLVVMHDVEVDTIKINSAVIPVRAASSHLVGGTNGGTGAISQSNLSSFITLLTATVIMPVAGFIEVFSTVHQSFTNGTSGQNWNCGIVIIDTTNVVNLLPETITGGSVPGDSVALSGSLFASVPGTYIVKVLWNAIPGVNVSDSSVFVKGFPYTA